MAMKRCPVCGERYNETYKTCPFCEEEEYWDDEQEDTGRRPLLREGTRSSGRGGRSAYSIVTPILIVLIILMALLLVYLLYGDKLKGGDKDPDEGKINVQTPVEPEQTPGSTPAAGSAGTPGDVQGGEDGNTPDTGMPEDEDGSSSGGMSYASAAALPGGLTLNNKDFTRKVSEGAYQLKVSGGTGTYTWISENPAVAAVSSDGTVTPVASGTTNVLVTDGSKKAVCVVRVTGGPAPASGGNTTTSGTTAPSVTTPNTTTPSTTTPSTTAPSSGGGSLKAGKAVVVNGGNGVRVRSGPGTNYDALATIPNGGSVQIVESAGNDWYKVTFTASGGVTTTGYMKGEFLSNS